MEPENNKNPGTNKQATPVPQTPTKRRVVDKSDVELSDPKRGRAARDPNDDAIALLLHWHEFLIRKFQVTNVGAIDTIADLTTIIWKIHTQFREDAGDYGMIKELRDDSKFKANGITLTYGSIKEQMKEIATMYGCIYWKTEATKKISSLLFIFQSYRSRLNEMRTGTSHILLKKSDNTVIRVPTGFFGLRNEHSSLLTGCSYHPTIQFSMMNLLGPMTIAINLAMQTDRRHQKAWKAAFIQRFDMFPSCREIADVIDGSEYEKDVLMTLLADIALWNTTRRAANKACFPFSFMLKVARINSKYVDFFNAGELPSTPILSDMIHSAIKDIDFSGKSAYIFWHFAQTADSKYTMTVGQKATTQTMQEVVFHAVWGTQTEDLSLLEWMTAHKFQNRRQIGKQLIGRKASTEMAEFKLIPFRYVAQLATASMGAPKIPIFSVFAGRRVSRVSDIEILMREASNQFYAGQYEIISKLRRIKEIISPKAKKDQSIAFVTTQFFIFSSESDYGPVAAEIPLLSKQYFYEQDDDF